MSADAPQPSPLLARLAALGGLALLIASTAWVVAERSRHAAIEPDDNSLGAAASYIGRDLQPSDGLVFSPGWAANQRWRFAELWRKKGMNLDETLILGDPIDLWDADGFSRLWVVTTHGDGKRLSLPAPARLLRRSDVGHGTAVALYGLGPSRTVLDLRKQLSQASVERQKPDGTFATCGWRGERFDCGADSWQDIWQGVHEVGNTRRSCIYVQPHRDGAVMRLSWTQPPGARILAGHFGLRLWAVRHEEGSDLRMRVRVGTRLAYETALAKDDFVYHAWQVTLRPEEAGADLHFEFSADNIQWRQACFDARLLDATPRVLPLAPAAAAMLPTSGAAPMALPLPRPGAHVRIR